MSVAVRCDEADLEVLLFGVQAQRAGASAVTVRVRPGEATVGSLRERLAEAAPALAGSLGASRFAVNHAYAKDDRILAGGEEVALIGLVGGG